MKKSSMKMPELAQLLFADADDRAALGELSDRQPREYRQRWNGRHKTFFERMKVADIDTATLRRFRATMVEDGLKGTSISVHMSQVSKMLRLAVELEVIDRVPNIPRPKHRLSPRVAFSRPEYRHLLNVMKGVETGKPYVIVKGRPVSDELRWMVTFQLNSFLRPGDLFKLRHRHVEMVPGDGPNPPYLKLNLPASKNHSDPVITMPVAVKIYERAKDRQRKQGRAGPDDFVFMPEWPNRRYALELARRQFTEVLKVAGLKKNALGEDYTLYSLRHTAIVFRLLNAKDLDLLTLARACRTSVEMIDRFYAKSLTAEMNRDKLHSFKRPTRYAA